MDSPPAASSERPVVIVTGSSGLLGTAVLSALADRYQVVGFDRDGQPQPPPAIECVCVDLTDDESVHRGVDRVVHAYGDRIAAVVHLAAYYDFSGSPSELYQQVNVLGTERLLRALRRHGCEVGAFVFSSSMLVHCATEPGDRIREDSRLCAAWHYPRSKAAAEQLLRQLGDDLRVIVLRIAGVYSDRCDSIPLAHQIDRIDRRALESRLFPGNARHGQAFVHIDDVVDAITRAVDRRASLPREFTPILIGEPETWSYGELQRRLASLMHGTEHWRVLEIPKALARAGAWLKDHLPGDQFVKPWMIDLADDHYELDVTRAERLLGWRPRHRLVDALPRMVNELRTDPDGWRAHHLEHAVTGG